MMEEEIARALGETRETPDAGFEARLRQVATARPPASGKRFLAAGLATVIAGAAAFVLWAVLAERPERPAAVGSTHPAGASPSSPVPNDADVARDLLWLADVDGALRESANWDAIATAALEEQP